MPWSTKPLATLFMLIHLGLLSSEWQSGLAQEASSEPAKEQSQELVDKINHWIRELDDDSFQVREKAEKNLVEIGLPAWDAISKATESPSNEVRTRARKVLATYRQLKKHLQFVASESRPELRYAVSTTVSADGKFVYAAAWLGNSVCVYSRDAKSGRLSHLQTIQDQETLAGAISVRLSPDGGYALVPAFLSQTAVLFRRDAKSGKLTVSDVARQGQNGVEGLRWALESVFAPDSKFVYVIDPRGTGTRIETVDGQPGAVTTFQMTEDGKLKWLEVNHGQEECFNGTRGIAIHPDGQMLFATSSGKGALIALSRDEETGRTEVRQILRDGEKGIEGLEGVSSLAMSPDGRFIYTCSGRFHGDNAVGVYEVGKDGTVSKVQEIHSGNDGLEKFEGGNEILVSPDGKHVYAAATRSETLVSFERDLKTGRLSSPEVTEFRSLGPPGTSLGPAGLGISPDGKHLYVALESSGAIAIFECKPPAGK